MSPYEPAFTTLLTLFYGLSVQASILRILQRLSQGCTCSKFRDVDKLKDEKHRICQVKTIEERI